MGTVTISHGPQCAGEPAERFTGRSSSRDREDSERSPDSRSRDMDDAEAVRQCRAGRVDAFQHLVRRYQGRALAHGRALTGNHADAADAAQEAFIDAFRNLGQFDLRREFYPWFYVLLRHRCFKQRTRPGTRPESGPLPEREAAQGPSPEQAIDLHDALARLD